MTSPNRCSSLHRRIDALDEARTVQGLVKGLKPILDALAFNAVTGDASIAAYQEQWHDQFTSELYSDAGSDASAAAAVAAPQKDSARPPLPRVSSTRPHQPMSASLQSILNGTHPSLRE